MNLSSAEAIRLRVLKEEIAIAHIHGESQEIIDYLNRVVIVLEKKQSGTK